MIAQSVIDNFVAWTIQVCVIGFIGAALPLVFRIRHPRSRVVYCQLLFVICLILPLIRSLSIGPLFLHFLAQLTRVAICGVRFCRSADRARFRRDLTVPVGICSVWAISS